MCGRCASTSPPSPGSRPSATSYVEGHAPRSTPGVSRVNMGKRPPGRPAATVPGELGRHVVVEFRILGPIEVSSEGGPVTLGGGRQRAVLALLLLRLGEVVSTEQLVEELWAGRPPATATKVVQLYVSRLRKQLGDGLLLTRAPGYVLRVDPDNLDAHRFERLFEEGRRALAGGDPALAAPELREALSLWRGPALADFTYEPFAQGEISRLEELRLACLEERIEADLALGAPFRAGRRARGAGRRPAPARASSRSAHARPLPLGRQAEALAVYQEARRTLVEQLESSRAPRSAPREGDPQPGPRARAAGTRRDARRRSCRVRATRASAEDSRALAAPQERKLATVIFVDLVARRARGGRPRANARAARALLRRDGGRDRGRRGTVEKFAGDASWRSSGLPRLRRTTPCAPSTRRSRCAIGSRSSSARHLALRIGVDTGEVVVGRPRRAARSPPATRSTWPRGSSRRLQPVRSSSASAPSPPHAARLPSTSP